MGKLSSADISSALEDFEETPKTWRPKKPKEKQIVKVNDQGGLLRYTDQGRAVRVWTASLDTNAWNQAQSFANLPFVHPKGLALMPDVHVGKDVPVGSVLPTLGVLVPAAVGVDIGCGMVACRLNLKANDLPDHLRPLRREIEKRVPVDAGGRHHEVPDHVMRAWMGLEGGWQQLAQKTPRAARPKAYEQLGTLGSGNHFIEVCVDQSQDVWVMIHSGSRGAGAQIGQHFIDAARRRVRENGTAVGHLGWLCEDDPLFEQYVFATHWAQSFAMDNRACMLQSVLGAFEHILEKPIAITGEAVNCHHNYIAKEHHNNEDVWITRKGAIRAGVGEWGIIPGAMGQESVIVKGKGHSESWCSCSHGAGRVMSRTAASQRFTAKDLRAQTTGVECRKDKAVVDEIPSAYKPLKTVLDEQRDLIEVVHRLKAVLCVKGI